MVIYDGTHSMTIIPDGTPIYNWTTGKMNGINTWNTWRLIPSSRPVFNPPSPKTNLIDIPGANGVLDATEILTSFVAFNNREGNFEFYVANGYKEWYDRYSQIMQYLHGRKVKVILSDDLMYYYQGRMSVNQWRSEKDYSKIVLNYSMDPYKYECIASDEDWLWDPFSFPNGIIRNYKDFVIRNTNVEGDHAYKEIYVENNYLPVVPTFKIKHLHTLAIDPVTAYCQIRKYGSDNTTVVAEKRIYPTDYLTHEYKWYDVKISRDARKIAFWCPANDEYQITMSLRGGKL